MNRLERGGGGRVRGEIMLIRTEFRGNCVVLLQSLLIRLTLLLCILSIHMYVSGTAAASVT